MLRLRRPGYAPGEVSKHRRVTPVFLAFAVATLLVSKDQRSEAFEVADWNRAWVIAAVIGVVLTASGYAWELQQDPKERPDFRKYSSVIVGITLIAKTLIDDLSPVVEAVFLGAIFGLSIAGCIAPFLLATSAWPDSSSIVKSPPEQA